MTTESTESLVFSVEQARRRLGLSRGLVYEAIRSGHIPSIRIGRRILIPRSALENMLDECRAEKNQTIDPANHGLVNDDNRRF